MSFLTEQFCKMSRLKVGNDRESEGTREQEVGMLKNYSNTKSVNLTKDKGLSKAAIRAKHGRTGTSLIFIANSGTTSRSALALATAYVVCTQRFGVGTSVKVIHLK